MTDRWTVNLAKLPLPYYIVQSNLDCGGVVHRNRSCGFLHGRPHLLENPYLSRRLNWRWCSRCGGVSA